MPTEFKRMRQIHGTDTNWASVSSSFIPALGEVLIERHSATDVRMKIGDQTRPFSLLPYVNSNVVSSGVQTFAGRSPVSGNIAPATGDYTSSMITESSGRLFMTSSERTKLAGIDVSRFLPSGGSPGQVLTKSTLTDYDVEWATVTGGGGGGDQLFVPTWGSDYGLIFDGVTDQTNQLNNILAAAVPGTTIRLYSPTDEPIMFSSRVRVPDFITLDLSQVDVNRKKYGEVAIVGGFDELPAPPTSLFRLRANAAPGDSVLQIDIPTTNPPSMSILAVDSYGIIRGKSDGAANALQRHEFRITAQSAVAGSETITIDPPIPDDEGTFLPVYPAGEYEANFGIIDRTLISIKVGQELEASVTKGAEKVEVDDPSLFPVGSVCQLLDSYKSKDIAGTSNNSIRDEILRVKAIDSTFVYFDTPIERDYTTGRKAVLFKLRTITGAKIIGARSDTLVEAVEANPNPRKHYYVAMYADRAILEGISINELAQTFYHRGQAGRIYHSIDCQIRESFRLGPAGNSAQISGDIYGFSAYYSRNTQITRVFTSRCRHGALDQGGTFTTISHGGSRNDLINAVDFHGLNSVGGVIHDYTITLGNDFSPDSSTKSGVTLGNTSHLGGDQRVSIRDVEIRAVKGLANTRGILVQAGCTGISMNNCRVTDAEIGVFINRSSYKPDLIIDDINIVDCRFEGIAAETIRVTGAQTQWVTGATFNGSADRPVYCENAGKVYSTANSGVAGATAPTHSSGTVSDGTLSWLFVASPVFFPVARVTISSNFILGCNRGIVGWRVSEFKVLENKIGDQATPTSTTVGDLNPSIDFRECPGYLAYANYVNDYLGGIAAIDSENGLATVNVFNDLRGETWFFDRGDNDGTFLDDNKLYGPHAALDASGGSTITVVAPGSGVVDIDDLSDVGPFTGLAAGHILQWNGTIWTNAALASGGLPDAPSDGLLYGREDALWVPIPNELGLLTDVLLGTPVTGELLRYNGTAWVNSPDAATAHAVTSHTDVAVSSITDGQILVYRSVDNKFHNENQASGGTMDRITKNLLVGPITHNFVAGDCGELTYLDLAAGDINIVFDNTLSHADTEVLLASFMTINANGTYKVNFYSGGGAVAAPTLVQSFRFKKTSGVSGVAMSAPDTHNFTVNVGNDLVMFVNYFTAPANDASLTGTPGVLLNSVSNPWTQENNAVNNAPKLSMLRKPLGNITSAAAYTARPEWTDNTIGTYYMGIDIFSGANQATPADPVLMSITTSGSTGATPSVAALGPQRNVLYFGVKRGNSGGGAITQTGATLISEEPAGAGTIYQNLRVMSAREVQAAAGTATCTITYPAAHPHSEVAIPVIPVSSASINVAIVDGKPANCSLNNHLINVTYDKFISRVGIVY